MSWEVLNNCLQQHISGERMARFPNAITGSPELTVCLLLFKISVFAIISIPLCVDGVELLKQTLLSVVFLCSRTQYDSVSCEGMNTNRKSEFVFQRNSEP